MSGMTEFIGGCVTGTTLSAAAVAYFVRRYVPGRRATLPPVRPEDLARYTTRPPTERP